jgi:RNA polymerase sigma factor for flagellar operon FliA
LTGLVRRSRQKDPAPLWARWRETGAAEDRDALVEHYTVHARILAAKCFSNRVSHELEFGDYMQFGMVGLLESIDRFDDTVGVKFETFAGHRIQGAILNGIENMTEVQKQTAVRRRVLRERTASLAEKSTKDPVSALERLAEVAIGLALGFALEDSGIYAGEGEAMLPDNAYSRVEMRQLSERLAESVESLPEQLRLVIHRHYFQQVPFDEIAATMKLTKGRISQIHRSALMQLRELQKRHATFSVTA